MNNFVLSSIDLKVINNSIIKKVTANILIAARNEQQLKEKVEKLLSFQETGEPMNLSVPTMYSKVCKGVQMEESKILYFSRNQLINYLKASRRKSSHGIEAEADILCLTRKMVEMKGKTTNPFYKRQFKDNSFDNQFQTVFHYLQKNLATASMIAAATNIPQKNICRYKRNLEKDGRLWEVEKRKCLETGFKAWYLTTNPEHLPKSIQLSLF